MTKIFSFATTNAKIGLDRKTHEGNMPAIILIVFGLHSAFIGGSIYERYMPKRSCDSSIAAMQAEVEAIKLEMPKP